MQARFTPEKLIAYGMGLAAIVAVAIWQTHPRGGFLQAPGWATIGVGGLGSAIATLGLFSRGGSEDGPTMSQTAGGHSVQRQAGRDMIDVKSDED
jgi:hypothetical protein